jgi:hypothetical protein
MPTDNYERYRKRVEDQLRTDMGLLYEAHLAKLRAFQTVERLRGNGGNVDNIEVDSRLESEISAYLQPVAAPASPVVPSPAGTPRRSGWFEVIEAVEAALAGLPEEFDRFDVAAALDFEPRRSTLLEALQTLTRTGVLTIAREAAGKRPTVFRKADVEIQPAGG